MLFTHYFVQIHPRGIDTFTPGILPAVEHVIQDLNPQVGHADFVNVRETHGKADIYLVFILHNRVYLPADITGRLLYI